MLRNLAAGLFLPLPDTLDKFLAAEVVLGFAFRVEQAFDHHLRRNAGMIHAGLPQRAVSFHAVIACQRIHDRVLERVPHVQGAGHVWRWDHDAIGFAIAGRGEIALRFPALVEALFDVPGLVRLVH